ncbi:type ISP restriction/modification enzyme [Mesorhizobium sp. B4-1-1]|uniref:type ISP restriction/modification enzyme n=1 Tax=Mesorhizobium sp. B4-1-1 TaxID=2589890 RepID=UPI0011271F5B|nr:type ISP restriction/modification enzyme [Mesorhizobium sp. B4-1-1]TPI18918.1 DNA methyltransferase [Mesorhizobium sp. B4-1-1]
MAGKTVADTVSAYGASLKPKLTNPAIGGAPEDQLRGPLETLIRELATLAGYAAGSVHLVGETSLADIKTRPDFAITINNALVGFIEVKQPGKGADPRHFSDPHDKDQWNKLKSLPNLLYTDGNAFSLWRDGTLVGKPVALEGDLETSGAKLQAPDGLLPLLADFLSWAPIAPSNAKRLAEVSARLCRLLRDEVVEQLGRGSEGLTALAKDWRKLLFPEADDAQFADGYAQAVTFGLLVARALDISLADGIHQAAYELRKTNSLIGTALGLLTDDQANQQALKTSLQTLTRVLDEVNWHTISKDKPEAWLYFYEDFLEVYDNTLRKKTGSYYTPPEVVSAMVRLVDEALRGPLFERHAGLASSDVTLADPAVGTGTFLLGVLRHIASTVADDQGEGAVRGAIVAAAQRLIGFELQFGPFAVAQLRLIAEMQALMKPKSGEVAQMPELKLFITNTLGNPFVEEETLVQVGAVAKSRRDANTIKKTQKITVVIGNPPYKVAAKGLGGWIEAGAGGKMKAPMDWWMPPRAWGAGAHAKHLKNLYVYFWRWATWKVFGTGNYAATGFPEKDEEGIVCFITATGFLGGDGFQRMRDDLRRTCSEIWVIDCSPDGHQPEVNTRFFPGVQHPVCIVLAAKKLGKDTEMAGQVRFRSLPKGRREEKFAALEKLTLDPKGWESCPSDWRAPFFPAISGAWAAFPPLSWFFDYDGSGVMAGRTWIIAPDEQSLKDRWTRLTNEKDAERKEGLFHPHLRQGRPGDKHIRKAVTKGLVGHNERLEPVIDDHAAVIQPVRYGFRSFDRQWVIPDARLINQPNPTLWDWHSQRQIYLTAPEDRSPTNGPALTFTAAIPDLHNYNGRGGRVHPLWRDAVAKQPNIPTKLLGLLADIYGQPVSAEDVMAYLAAAIAHPAFTKRFLPDLVQPGLRVPLTADPLLFSEAVALGREVIWLHTYGERFSDPAAERPKAPPRMTKDLSPTIPVEGTIPGAPESLPDTMEYDPVARRLHVGKGFVNNVSPEMWKYEVSGKQVVWHWFSYRKRDRSRPQIGDKRPPSPLDFVQPDHWLAEYTSDLIDLLNVLGRLVELEPAQADLLERILNSELIKITHLQSTPAAGEVAKTN